MSQQPVIRSILFNRFSRIHGSNARKMESGDMQTLAGSLLFKNYHSSQWCQTDIVKTIATDVISTIFIFIYIPI